MADSAEKTLHSAAATKSTETLSQFLARILDQLSLSAWLPSAAIVFIVGLAFSLRTVLGHARVACNQGNLDGDADPGCGIAAQLADAMSGLASTEWGGALLSIAAVIVLTMLTQAFAFEAIRVLEGYWGTSRIAKYFADIRSERHANVRRRLAEAHLTTTTVAWTITKLRLLEEWENHSKELRLELQKEYDTVVHSWIVKPATRLRRLRSRLDKDLVQRLAESPLLSPEMVVALEEAIFERESSVELSREGRLRALTYDWESRSTPALIRRRLSLDKRLRDYPQPGRELPTGLGNIMRRHEDMTGERLVEGFVIREFENLTLSLQVDHDDQRNRLDLYCTMVFVLPFSGIVAGLTLLPYYWYSGIAVCLAVVGSIVCYRAALATARAYGTVLLAIAEQVQEG